MKKAKEKRDSSRIQKIVDDQSGPGPPFFAITKNEGQGPLSPHHVKASTPRGGISGLGCVLNYHLLTIIYYFRSREMETGTVGPSSCQCL